MQKIDRLGWAAGFSFRAYGLLIGVRASDSAVLGDLRARLPFGSTPSEESEVDYLYSIRVGGKSERKGTRQFHVLYSDAAQLGRTLDWGLLLDAFEKDLELFVGERAHARVFVHAGVVTWKRRALLLPGKSLAGKSTLVAELVRSGATYFSDEFAVLDEAGLVHPFRRPLSLRENGEPGADKYSLDVVLNSPPTDPAPVTSVLVTTYREGARFRPRLVSPGIACLELLQHALAARTQPELVLPVLQTVTEGARIYKTLRGQASEVAQAVLALVENVPIASSRPRLRAREPLSIAPVAGPGRGGEAAAARRIPPSASAARR